MKTEKTQDKKKQGWLAKKHKLLIGLAIVGVIAILYRIDGAGFGSDLNISVTTKKVVNPKDGKIIDLTETTEHFQSAKTLWDWLGLAGTLAIPIVLYQFQRSEKEQDDTNSREEALLAYFKHISELLIDKKLKILINQKLETTDPDYSMLDAALDVARACTLSVLRRLDKDGERKGRVIRFLSDTELVSELDLELADLSYANLSNVKLKGANLGYANLSNADLSLSDERITKKLKREFSLLRPAIKNTDPEAFCSYSDPNQNVNLSDDQKASLEFVDSGIKLYCANLKNANLSDRFLLNACLKYAILRDANLTNVKLNSANLSNADLRNANLSGADLSDADLSGADLSGADLSGANLTNATLPNGKKYKCPEQLKQSGIEANYLPKLPDAPEPVSTEPLCQSSVIT